MLAAAFLFFLTDSGNNVTMQRASRRNTLMTAILALCFFCMLGLGTAIYASVSRTTPQDWLNNSFGNAAPLPARPAEPESFRFKPDIAADTAEEINAAVPNSTEPIVPALPFALASSAVKMSAIDCLAQAVYYEAASESSTGQHAVAQYGLPVQLYM
jgi:hypothetical protein